MFPPRLTQANKPVTLWRVAAEATAGFPLKTSVICSSRPSRFAALKKFFTPSGVRIPALLVLTTYAPRRTTKKRRLAPLGWIPAFAGLTETGRHSRAGDNPEKPSYTPRTGFGPFR